MSSPSNTGWGVHRRWGFSLCVMTDTFVSSFHMCPPHLLPSPYQGRSAKRKEREAEEAAQMAATPLTCIPKPTTQQIFNKKKAAAEEVVHQHYRRIKHQKTSALAGKCAARVGHYRRPPSNGGRSRHPHPNTATPPAAGAPFQAHSSLPGVSGRLCCVVLGAWWVVAVVCGEYVM
jgi:hypothetical protein